MVANVHTSHRMTARGVIFVMILPRYSQSEIQATKRKKKKNSSVSKPVYIIICK